MQSPEPSKMDGGLKDHRQRSREALDLFFGLLAEGIADRLMECQDMRRRLLDMEQTAEYLGMSEDTIQRLVSEGQLVPVRLDRRLRFDIRDLNDLVETSKRRAQ